MKSDEMVLGGRAASTPQGSQSKCDNNFVIQGVGWFPAHLNSMLLNNNITALHV